MISASVLVTAQHRPDAPAVISEHGTVSYGRLTARARERAAELEVELEPGSLLPLREADPAEQLAGVLAADLLDTVPLVTDARWTPDYADAVLRPLRGTRLEPALASSPSSTGSPGHRIAVFSSGSAGLPRVIVRDRASWADSFAPLSELIGLTESDAVLLPVPLVSSLSLFGALHALDAGCRLLLPASASESALLTLLVDATVTHTTPVAFLRMLEAVEAGAPTLLRLALIGGAALPNGVRARAAERGIRVVHYYGAAELSFVVVDLDGTGLRPFPGVQVRVERVGVDVGRLWARSPYLAEGYLGAGRGPFRRNAAGWATVGDLVTMPPEPARTEPAQTEARAASASEPGSCGGPQPLELRGREDGAILTAAATVVPEDVESVLRTLPGVRDAVVFGAPHPTLGAIVCVVMETTDAAGAADRARWQSACHPLLTSAQLPRRWYATEALPRTASGKPARAAVIAAALADAGGSGVGAGADAAGVPVSDDFVSDMKVRRLG